MVSAMSSLSSGQWRTTHATDEIRDNITRMQRNSGRRDALATVRRLNGGQGDELQPKPLTLMRTKTLKEADFLGQKTYVLADGSKVPSQTFRIRSLKVGNKLIEDVNGSVAPAQGSLLLGQRFLSRFKSWSVDNTKHELVFE